MTPQPTALRDLLEDAADVATADRTLDPAAVLDRAARPEYRPVVGTGSPRWRPRPAFVPLPRSPLARGLLVAASVAAVLALVLAAVPGLERALPRPARTPAAPGTIPRTLYLPPPWTPTVTERPISRAVYVGIAAAGTGSESDAGIRVPTPPAGPWLVGADGGALRLLPGVRRPDGSAGNGAEADLPTLSPDGTRVAWVTAGPFAPNSVVHVVDIPTGRMRSLGLEGTWRRGLAVGGLAFSPDGGYLALSGDDRPGANRTGLPTLLVLDVASGAGLRAVLSCRLFGDADGTVEFLARQGSQEAAFAWSGDDVIRTTGCTEQSTATAATTAPPRPVPAVAGDLPVAPDTAETFFAMGAPVATPPTVVGPQDARWFTRRTADGDSAPWQLWAVGAIPRGALSPAADRTTDLGTQAGAVALAATSSGVVVSRWQRDTRYPSGQFGPSDVVLVRLGVPSTVEVLSRADGVQPRVAAVAAAVVEGATSARTRIVDTHPPGARVLDTPWWSWVAAAGLHRIPLPGARFWVFVGIVALWLLVRRFVTRLPVRARPLLAGTAIAALLAVLVGPALVAAIGLPDAPVRAAPAGRTGVVVPAVLGDVRLVPPRAFDEPGLPRTTAVGIVVVGALAGREGVYATDAATGAWVRLDDLPRGSGRTRDLTGGTADANVAVSPNGRYVLLGQVRYDLEAAQAVDVVPDGVQVNLMPSGISRSSAVQDDGTVALVSADGKGRLYVYPGPGASGYGGLVKGLDAAYVRGGPDGRFLLALQPDGGNAPEDLVALLDVSGKEPVVQRIQGVDQSADVALDGEIQARLTADGVSVQLYRPPPAFGPAPRFPTGDGIEQPGGTDALWFGTGPAGISSGGLPTLVTLGGGRAADLAVVRTTIPSDRDGTFVPVELTRVALPVAALHGDPASALTVAASVVAAATPVPVPAEPWWSVLAR